MDSAITVCDETSEEPVRVAGMLLLLLAPAISARTIFDRSRVAEDRMAEGCVQTLLLPPYLETVVLDVAGARGAEVAVFAPDALLPLGAFNDTIDEIKAGDVLRTIVIRRPAPGRWRFRLSPGARIRILWQRFLVRGALVRPIALQMVRQHDRFWIDYRVFDNEGGPLSVSADYPLSLRLTLIQPDGQQRSYEMSRLPGTDSWQFRTRQQIECELAGRYWLNVEVTTRDLEGQRVSLLRDQASGFSVTPSMLIECGVAPAAGADRVDIQCRDEKRKMFDLSSAVRGSPNALMKGLLWRDGQLVEALAIDYVGLGRLRVVLQPRRAGGSYRLRLMVDRSRLLDSYNVRLQSTDLSFQVTGEPQYRVPIIAIAILIGLAAALRMSKRSR
ncbi:MAG TPA: hypothetical protein VMU84_11945 [Thermoanaerobaculia bacterium]|nr:hypothetical protein [Thermoanaerobaculia bacterium]